ncbi:hypothetical protein [Tunturiibacter gelidiferens]|uniref:hypothetical protein n=1 Tax=Tunturiibacter gelidiferens TaxID=3069689 RepID=UPI003D9B1F83
MRKILCALALLAFATPLLASDPFVGTWTLNSAKTKYTTGTAAKSVTLVIEEQGDSLQVTGTGTTGDGSPISVKYTVPIKGGVGTVQQGDFDGVNSKLVSSHSRLNTFTKAGKELRTRHAVVSADGKTLSTTVKGTGADGKPVAGVDVYDKQ